MEITPTRKVQLYSFPIIKIKNLGSKDLEIFIICLHLPYRCDISSRTSATMDLHLSLSSVDLMTV